MFDIALMNPPYDKNLHLKFLEKVIENAEKTVSVQPCGFLENAISSNYTKYKSSIVDKINDIDIISMKNARELFNATFAEDLMICVCKEDNTSKIDILKPEYTTIIDKILPYVKKHLITDIEETDKIDGHRVKIDNFKGVVYGSMNSDSESRRDACAYVDLRGPYLDGYNEGEDKKYKGKYFKDCYAKGGPSNSKAYNGFKKSIKFNTREEALNFQKSCNTNFCKNWNWMTMTKTLAIIPPSFDKIWTDEDFCKFFKLTDNESELMCKYIYDYRDEKTFVKYCDL